MYLHQFLGYPSIKNTRPVYKYKTGFNFFHQKTSAVLGFLTFWQAILKYVPKQAFSILNDIINIVNINVHDVNYFAIKVSIVTKLTMCECCKMNKYLDM